MADIVTPMVVRVAATLRVADHIAAGRVTAEEIAAASDADVDAGTLDRLLLYLVSREVLERDRDGRHTLTDLGEALRDDHPSGLRATLDIEGALGRAELAFAQLLHAVRTGDPAYPRLYGQGLWADLAADEQLASSFDRAMASDVAAWAPAIVSAFPWDSLAHLVDVGGGNGTLLLALLAKFPALRGTVLDVPATADAARATIAAAPPAVAARASAVAGDFFAPLPPGADAYMLTAIVHDWDDEPALRILRGCAEAAASNPGGGRVFVVEKIGTDGRSPNPQMDLRLLVLFGGRERSLGELIALCASAGLRLQAVHPAGAISILELTPVG